MRGLILTLVVLFLAPSAIAHEMRPGYLEIRESFRALDPIGRDNYCAARLDG